MIGRQRLTRMLGRLSQDHGAGVEADILAEFLRLEESEDQAWCHLKVCRVS